MYLIFICDNFIYSIRANVNQLNCAENNTRCVDKLQSVVIFCLNFCVQGLCGSNNRAYGIARNYQYDVYQRALVSMVYKFFDKKTGSGVSVNEQLAEESRNPVTKQLKKRNVYARFKGNVCAVDLAEM